MLEDSLFEFNEYVSLPLENISDLTNLNIYMQDIENVTCNDSEKNMELMKMVYPFICEMEKIFNLLGCNDKFVGKKPVPWIIDKINWCIKNSTDIDTINNLKDLYNDYCQLRDKIVCGNLRLVIMLAKEYVNDMDSMEDVVQYGNMGLIRAIEKFDIDKGVTFNTYAGYWIKQSMMRGIKSIKYPMKVPMNKIYESSFVMDARNELSLQLGRTVTDMELCTIKNISLKRIEELLLCFEEPLCLDEVLISDYDGKEYLRAELIADARNDLINEVFNLEYRKQLLNFLVQILNKKELLVLQLYFGLNKEEENLKEPEIAKIMGVSQQRVHQIKTRALTKLHKKTKIRDIVIV